MSEGVVVDGDVLRGFARDVFRGAGVPDDHASIISSVLVWADERGMASHGVSRIPVYLERLRSGQVVADPTIEVDRRRAALAVVRAHRASGQVAFDRAATTAVDLATDAGVGWVTIVDSSHAGAIGFYARSVAEHGMAAVVIAASRPTMAYHGSRTAGVATNPLAMAVPAGPGRIVAVDMATAVVSRGRLQMHRRSDIPLEPGWAIDSAGRPTTDPHSAEVPLPLGGPKGSGMALLFECLCNVMAGSPLIEPSLSGRMGRHAQGGMVAAVDITALRDIGAFEHDVVALVDSVKALPVADGHDEILVPGERGDRSAEMSERLGVPVTERVWERVVAAAGSVGVPPPAVGSPS